MLDGLLKFISNLFTFNQKVEEVLEKDIQLDSGQIVKLVQIQLSKGMDGNDERVYLFRHGIRQHDYAIETILRKEKYGTGLGAQTDVITNFMSGAFYASIYVKVLGNGNFEVLSLDPLYEIIKERSGADIINLSPESARFLVEDKIAPDIQNIINSMYEV